jgi:Flp pilus assembly pilin Flp
METRVFKNRRKLAGQHQTGAVMVEYVFLIIFICLVALLGIKTFGGTLNNKMADNNNSVANAIQ